MTGVGDEPSRRPAVLRPGHVPTSAPGRSSWPLCSSCPDAVTARRTSRRSRSDAGTSAPNPPRVFSPSAPRRATADGMLLEQTVEQGSAAVLRTSSKRNAASCASGVSSGVWSVSTRGGIRRPVRGLWGARRIGGSSICPARCKASSRPRDRATAISRDRLHGPQRSRPCPRSANQRTFRLKVAADRASTPARHRLAS